MMINVGIAIRKAKIEDFDRISELLTQLWPNNALTVSQRKDTFVKQLKMGKLCFVAQFDENIIGYASITLNLSLESPKPIAHIDEFIIKSNYRNKKMGSILLRHIEKVSKNLGCGAIELTSSMKRKLSHKFYLKNNYTVSSYHFWKDL